MHTALRHLAPQRLRQIERRRVQVTALALLLVLTGCASRIAGTAELPSSVPSTSGTSRTVGPGPSAAPATSSTPLPSPTAGPSGSVVSSSPPQGTTTDGSTITSESATPTPPESGPAVPSAAFVARLKAANAKVKTIKGSISVVAGAAQVSGTFGETLTGGRVDALDMSMFISEGTNDVPLRMLIVGDKVYLGGNTVLRSLDAGTKKWALASRTSKNPALRKLADQLDGYLTTASANQYELYAAAAKSIADGGPQQIGGVQAHRYTVTVDVVALSKLSNGTTRTSMLALADNGVATLPTTLWLDGSDRLVESETTVTLRGITSRSIFKVIGYDVPVSIKAPSAADVFTG